MEIQEITENKKRYLDLLLLADEQENMIDRYLDQGDLFILSDPDLRSLCVVTKTDDLVYEIKNIATYPRYQRQGYGRRLIEFVFDHYKDRCKTLFVGTGDHPPTLRFYENCGFRKSHRVKNFFIDNCDHPIIEDGVQLVDMVYLRKDFRLEEK